VDQRRIGWEALVNVFVYVEGGGDAKSTRVRCQEGFRGLIDKILTGGRRPRIVACGTRRAAFDRFVDGLGLHTDAICLLLVDSEGAVGARQSPWAHVAASDSWRPPPTARDEHLHFMVQCMEAWLASDADALARFYGQGFKADALPKPPNIEQVTKADLERALKASTRATQSKGRYDKGAHSFLLLALVDPARVSKRAPHARRFFEALTRSCSS
jgi:hypothetical protein